MKPSDIAEVYAAAFGVHPGLIRSWDISYDTHEVQTVVIQGCHGIRPWPGATIAYSAVHSETVVKFYGGPEVLFSLMKQPKNYFKIQTRGWYANW